MPSRRPAKRSWDHALRLATRHIMPLGHWHGRFASGPRYGALAHDKREDADNSVPRLTPNTPSISTSIRWAESTCPPPSSTSSRSTPLSDGSQPQRAKPLRHAISVCVKADTCLSPTSGSFLRHSRLAFQRVVQFRHAAYRVIPGGHLMCCSHAMLCQREVAQRQTREIGPRQLGVCFYHTKALVSHANSPSRQDPGRGRSGQQLSETTGPREASFHCSLGSASGMCRPLNE